MALEHKRHEVSTTFQGSLFQHLTILIEKRFLMLRLSIRIASAIILFRDFLA